jgi:hypothetical protein
MRYFFGPELELMFNATGFQLVKLGQFPDIEQAPIESNWNAFYVAEKIKELV